MLVVFFSSLLVKPIDWLGGAEGEGAEAWAFIFLSPVTLSKEHGRLGRIWALCAECLAEILKMVVLAWGLFPLYHFPALSLCCQGQHPFSGRNKPKRVSNKQNAGR